MQAFTPTTRRPARGDLAAQRAGPPALALALVLATFAIPAHAQGIELIDPGQHSLVLDVGDSRARELSGITHATGDQYYAVSDKGGRLFPMTFQVDLESGFIRDVRIEAPIRLQKGIDLEGIAYDPDEEQIFVVDERWPAIRIHRPGDGKTIGQVDLPPIYRTGRPNRNLESLTYDAGLGQLWTVNEEALREDGPIADLERGSLVRIQRFGRNREPAGQWAYRTEPIPGNAARGSARNGVVDLLVLPGGELLALERSLGQRGLGAQIFLVEFGDATDVSHLDSLATGTFEPTRKRSLWKIRSLTGAFEGMTLGPRLNNGDQSLILLSDDAGILAPMLYALRLRTSWTSGASE